MKPDFKSLIAYLSEKFIPFLTDEPLSAHSTFRIGGPAAIFLIPKCKEQLSGALWAVKEYSVPYFILGKGSNVLFDDWGFSGAVISTSELDSISFDGKRITAQCGASITRLASLACERCLTGMEFAYGIPGSVGGAVYMNAGAYGSDISSVLVSSEYIDSYTLEIKYLDFDSHELGYRSSAFKNGGMIHLSSEFVLEKGDRAQIQSLMNDYMNRRKDKQPLEFPSAGSTFKRYPGRYTGQMIEEAGLKGVSVGGAVVSEKHAGFIVNKGNAKCSDVLELIQIVKNRVRDVHGIDIECEIIYVGKDG